MTKLEEVRIRYLCPGCGKSVWIYSDTGESFNDMNCWFCKKPITWKITIKEVKVGKIST